MLVRRVQMTWPMTTIPTTDLATVSGGELNLPTSMALDAGILTGFAALARRLNPRLSAWNYAKAAGAGALIGVGHWGLSQMDKNGPAAR